MDGNSINNEQLNICSSCKKLAAVCGLFCPACHLYIGTIEDPERLKKLAKSFQIPAEEFECNGCRSEKRSIFCRTYYKISECAIEKDVNFCIECTEYPCMEFKESQDQMPHRIELRECQKRIGEVGYEKWYEEMVEHYSCPKCHTINSAYDISCRKCGNTPSCNYVKLHKDEIIKSLSKSGNQGYSIVPNTK